MAVSEFCHQINFDGTELFARPDTLSYRFIKYDCHVCKKADLINNVNIKAPNILINRLFFVLSSYCGPRSEGYPRNKIPSVTLPWFALPQ